MDGCQYLKKLNIDIEAINFYFRLSLVGHVKCIQGMYVEKQCVRSI